MNIIYIILGVLLGLHLGFKEVYIVMAIQVVIIVIKLDCL